MRTISRFIIFLTMIILVLGSISWFTLYIFVYFFVPPMNVITYAYAFFMIVPIILLITTLIGNRHYSRINSWIYTVAVLWIPLLLYLFIGAIAISILSLFVSGASLTTAAIVIGVAIICFYIWGIYIARAPKIVSYVIQAPKLKQHWGNKKIVLFSDSHLGMVRHKKFMQKIVDMINTLDADIVFIAGDLIDGPVFPYEEGLAPLSQIKSTFGVFYTAGNHDEYNSEQKKYYAVLETLVTVLNDKKIMVNETQIAGIMFAVEKKKRTQERLQNAGFDKTLPSIVMLHDPRNVEALADEGVMLALSGHTHGGQFFPTTLLIRGSYGILAKGVNYLKGMAHITSVGAGTSGPMFRLGTQPEIAVIEIQ